MAKSVEHLSMHPVLEGLSPAPLPLQPQACLAQTPLWKSEK